MIGFILGFAAATALAVYKPDYFAAAKALLVKGINAAKKAFSSAPPAQ